MELSSHRLTVALSEPGTDYRRTRFDWTGFITQVTLDGRHTFCTQESLSNDGRSSDGVGLCSEFGIFTPIGYEDAAVGDTFPKLGVGLLTRADAKPYHFGRDYACQPFPMQCERHDDSGVTFVQEPLPCRGYAARCTKRLEVEASRLTIHYRLENTGTKPLLTEEYNHNFLAINREPVGPDYVLELEFPACCETWPAPMALAPKSKSLNPKATPLTFTAAPAPGAAFYCRPTGFSATAGCGCVLRHSRAGAAVHMATDFPLSMLAIWGVAHVVSPELFYQVNLQPGAVATWTRSYEFIA